MDKKNTTQLQFFRFAMMLPIFYWHAMGSGFNSHPLGFTQLFHVGLDAVSFFFFLSGFISSYHSYDKEVKVTASGICRYVFGKLKRLYPLYLVITLYSLMFYELPEQIAKGMFYEARYLISLLIRHLLLIQTWVKVYPGEYFCFSEVGWYLSAIVFLFAINMPLRALGMRIRRACAREDSKLNETAVFSILLIITYLLTVLWNWSFREMDLEFWGNTIPISRAGEYIAGMLLGYILRSVRFDEKAEKIPRLAYTFIELAAILFWYFWGYYAVVSVWAERIVRWFLSNLILIAVFTPGRGWISELFRKDPLRYPGDISFEFFLIHSMVLKTFIAITDSATLVTYRGDLLSMYGCMVLSLMMAALAPQKPFRSKPTKPAPSGQKGT